MQTWMQKWTRLNAKADEAKWMRLNAKVDAKVDEAECNSG